MDTSGYIKIAIGASILVLIVAAFVVPILDGISYSETETNTPTGYATKTVPDGEYRLTTDGFTINGAGGTTLLNGRWLLISDSVTIEKWSNQLVIYDYKTDTRVATQSITITGQTWATTVNDTSYTGSIGNGAVVRSATGELGTFESTPFVINKQDNVMFFRLNNVEINGTTYTSNAIVSGPLDNLKVDGLCLVSGSDAIFIDPDDVTASFRAGSYAVRDLKTFEVSSNPGITISITYNGATYDSFYGYPIDFVGPLTYTVATEGPIQSLLGVVPLIMFAGIVTAIIGALILRRT